MKQSLLFWIASGIAQCCVATVSPTQAQDLGQSVELGQTVSPEQFAPLRSAVSRTVRSHRPIPAWSSISSRWMFVDISDLLAPACPAERGQEASQFIITGRGGLPPSPSEALRTSAVRVDLDRPIQSEENRSSAAPKPHLSASYTTDYPRHTTNSPKSPALSHNGIGTPSTNPTSPAPTQIVEAQGWVINNKGSVVLTARPFTVTPHSPRLTAATCHTSKTSL